MKDINVNMPLSPEDQDILGEIGNIIMGTASSTLSMVLQQRVDINTPKVCLLTWEDLRAIYNKSAVVVRVNYKEGLRGSNVLILKERDVKIITDIMMGGAGTVTDPVELNEMDMSAISEAMNQMVGSTATSLSAMLDRRVDISTPAPFVVDFADDSSLAESGLMSEEAIIMVDFHMEIGELVRSEVVQIYQMGAAIELVTAMKESLLGQN